MPQVSRAEARDVHPCANDWAERAEEVWHRQLAQDWNGQKGLSSQVAGHRSSCGGWTLRLHGTLEGNSVKAPEEGIGSVGNPGDLIGHCLAG